ncbi:MAG TPA: DUF6455 family protein [Burkholderiales bacterium]
MLTPGTSARLRAEERMQLLGRMMARLEVDVDRAARELLGYRLREMIVRCRGCRHPDLCARWLEGETSGEPRFCPNVRLFAAFRSAA